MDEHGGIEIAIIGMDGRFPGADNVDQLWRNIIQGKETISYFTKEELLEMGVSAERLNNPAYVRAKGVIQDPESFDAEFFDYSAKEAMLIDPQARVFLETAWKALEDAGYAPSKYEGNIAVYAGTAMNTYILHLAVQGVLGSIDDFDLMLGNDKDLLSMRVSYKMNLTGPSVTVQSTCSTSLVAVHMACQSLLSGECDMAIAGGVSIQFPIKQGYTYREGMIHSKDGHCRPFDSEASGTIFSDGVGAVVLKRLEDALQDRDPIYAVIKGSAINNDGTEKVGFTAPSITGQSNVIKEALLLSNVGPETIQYVEAHGTGTKLGDPIEMKALTDAYSQMTTEKQYCAIGSIKANVGHLNTAAGVTGLIKTALALKNRQLPPTVNFRQPNPELYLADSPFYINQQAKPWETRGTPRRASVSSFGIGGTNAHVVLEEAPPERSELNDKDYYLVPLSARTSRALEENARKLASYLEQNTMEQIKDVAYTLTVGREDFEYRAVLVGNEASELVAHLQNLQKQIQKVDPNAQLPVYFLFPGQGSQYVNMGKDLYEHEVVFKETVDDCARILQPKLGRNIVDILYPLEAETTTASDLLTQTEITQPVIFTIEYALSKLLLSWGIKPAAMIGHSLGEYVAACLSGVMNVEDALVIIAERGRLIQNQPQGQMLAVKLTRGEVEEYLNPNLSLAAENGPQLCVLSGDHESIEQVEQELKAKGIFSQKLKTSHAFHSHMMEEAIEPFERYIASFPLQAPAIPFVSNVTGSYITADEATSPRYWAEHIRKPVLFTRGIENFLQKPAILLEVGPGKTLIGLARQQGGGTHVYTNLLPHPYENEHDVAYTLRAVGTLWSHGIPVDLLSLFKKKTKRLHLPTYSFEKVHYSLLAQRPIEAAHESEEPRDSVPKISVSREKLSTAYLAPRDETEQVLLDLLEEGLGLKDVSITDNFFELGGDSLIASRYVARINELLAIQLPIEAVIQCGNVESLAQRVNEILLEEIACMSDEQVEEALKGN